MLRVRDVLTLSPFDQAVVVAGHGGLDRGPVRWVSVIETPVEHFVREGDLVLSTAIGLGEDEQALLQFVREIHASGAVALGFAVGRFIQATPARVRAWADEERFPILELPWEVRFSALAEAVLRRIIAEPYRQLEESVVEQRLFREVILRGAGPREVVSALARLTHKAAWVLDSAGEPIAQAYPSRGRARSPLEREARALVAELRSCLRGDPGAAVREPVRREGLLIAACRYLLPSAEGAPAAVLVAPVRLSDGIWGYCAVLGGTEDDLLRLELAVTALTVHFMRVRAEAETEARIKDDFVWSLACERYGSEAQARERARLLRYDLDRRYVALVWALPGGSAAPERGGLQAAACGSGSGTVEEMAARVRRALSRWAQEGSRELLLTRRPTLWLAYVGLRQGEGAEEAGQLAQAMRAALQAAVGSLPVTVGVSEPFQGIRGFAAAYRQARDALLVGRACGGSPPVVAYREVEVRSLLLRQLGDAALAEACARRLQPLEDYDGGRPRQLLDTLRAYFRHQGNVTRTARELHLHRQSLLYRLRKIEQLTGCRLDDPEEAFALQTCLRLYDLRQALAGLVAAEE